MDRRTAGRRPRWEAAVFAAMLVLGAVGCSSGDDETRSTTTTTAAPTTTAPTTTAVAPAPPAAVPGTGGVTVDPDPVPVGAGDTEAMVKVSWTGQQPNTLMFLRICRLSVTDPKFNEGIDCSLLSELNPNGTADGNGSIEMPVFRGENPDGGSGWGCFAAADPAPPDVQKNTTCYVRVTNDVVSNRDDDIDAPFTFRVT